MPHSQRYHVWFRAFRAFGHVCRFNRMDTTANQAPNGDKGFLCRADAEAWVKIKDFGYGSVWIDVGSENPNRR